MSSTVLGAAAATWGVVMALSPVLQIRRMIHFRSSRDVSIGYLAVISAGFVIWVGYGISISNVVLIVPNTIALCVGLLTIGVTMRYRAGDQATASRKKLRGWDSNPQPWA